MLSNPQTRFFSTFFPRCRDQGCFMKQVFRPRPLAQNLAVHEYQHTIVNSVVCYRKKDGGIHGSGQKQGFFAAAHGMHFSVCQGRNTGRFSLRHVMPDSGMNKDIYGIPK